MVEVLEVPARSWKPPHDRNWVGVYVLGTGTPPWGGLEGVKDEPPIFMSDNNAPDVATAIEKATQWAEAHEAPVVYVIRGVNRGLSQPGSAGRGRQR